MRLCYSLVMFMALIMLSAGFTVIAGCGKKGPLYQPSEVQQQADKAKKTSTKTKPSP